MIDNVCVNAGQEDCLAPENPCFGSMRYLTLFALAAGVSLQAQPAITVYNANFGVVRDTLPLSLDEGVNSVTYGGATALLEPESVVLRDPEGAVRLNVLEQSYRGDPVDRDRLLQMFEGRTIEFLQTLDGKEVVREGTIVRAPSVVRTKTRDGNTTRKRLSPVIEMEGKLRTRLPGVPLFPGLGDDSVLRPTLSWKLHADREANVDAELSYLTNGMSWKADYNLMLPEEGDTLTLTGWVSIENATGKTFEGARIKLIAGDVNKVKENAERPLGEMLRMRADAPAAAPRVEEKQFDEFRMYTLPRTTTLRDQETKQVEFVRAGAVKTKKRYVYDGANLPNYWRQRSGVVNSAGYASNPNPDVAVYREFANTEANGLGVPLPAGRTRFYRADSDGQLEFVGENTIDHTPEKETVRVYLGNAFDLVGEREAVSFFTHPSRDLIRETFEIEIRNRSEEAVTVRIVEHLYRWTNWTITEHSRDYGKKDARTIEFPVDVGADASETVRYTVEYTW